MFCLYLTMFLTYASSASCQLITIIVPLVHTITETPTSPKLNVQIHTQLHTQYMALLRFIVLYFCIVLLYYCIVLYKTTRLHCLKMTKTL